MRGILVDENVKVYSEPNEQNLSVTTLRKGDEFELGKVSKKKGEVWVEVTTAAGVKGFIAGGSKIFVIKKVQLLSDQEELHQGPSAESPVIKTYPKKTVVTAVGVEKEGDKGWVKTIDSDGIEGYIRGDTKIRLHQEPTKEGGRKMMLTGGMFALLAVAFYIYSLKQAQPESSMSLLMVAVFVFGLFQLVQGILEYVKATKPKDDQK